MLTVHLQLLTSLLRLNILIVQHLSTLLETTYIQRMDSSNFTCRAMLNSFANKIFTNGKSKNIILAYSLLYLSQEAVTYRDPENAMRYYLNSIHLHNNCHIDIIYSASKMLADCKT